MMIANRSKFLLPGIIALALSVLLLAAFTKGPAYYNYNAVDPWNHLKGAPPTDLSVSTSPNSTNPLSPILVDRPHKKRVITTSVFTSSYVPLAMMLGYSIMKHNDLAAMEAEMVAMILKDDGQGNEGVTDNDVGYLMKAGWQLREVEPLDFEGTTVNESLILPHHRFNLNKLQIFRWTEYEKLLFIDADCAVRGDLSELFHMPGPFAAAPDVWFDILVDDKFNSGVMVLTPNLSIFQDMLQKLPAIHQPEDGDQAFLQVYWKFRYFGLPYRYNLNQVMFAHFRSEWDKLWDEAIIVHLTTHKPNPDPARWCLPPGEGTYNCEEWGPLGWYREYFTEMLHAFDLVGEIDVRG
ncbi:nucleotide-diphospho-sugar transferase [Eremomyces bilateralis CBS 781.70]|uniref:Nucleotide-diphospho-sugar transferase n=1 Tax=Eremomyces bilateralis CBS 781.70 TaxID=1392243 RepID=A0A6G1FRQ4_9PEZI|nr:nucleotide-diphospho-sugar transferase [Eremomyces bilateralis CBS 781.70]KAF1808371.1 nucleotide-diphospho-sugar transferase [Eremomyces bilateralis CBS 781.70]